MRSTHTPAEEAARAEEAAQRAQDLAGIEVTYCDGLDAEELMKPFFGVSLRAPATDYWALQA